MRSAIVSLLMAATASGALHAGGQLKPEDPIIRIDSATTARLCADCATREIRFAVTVLSGLTLVVQKDERPQVMEVSAGGTRDVAAEQSFEGKWELGPDNTPRALVLIVTPALRTQGTYTVMLNVLPNQRPLAPRVQLQIIVPAARLLVPTKLLIERTVAFRSVESAPASFTIRETSRASNIQTLSFDPPELMSGSDVVTGRVLVDIKPSSTRADAQERPVLAANQQATAAIAVDGHFPLGVAAGQLRLSAPELAEAVVIPVEVRSRLSRAYLFASILVGIVLSWWLKVFTHGVIERNTARASSAALLKRVRDDWSGILIRCSRKLF